MDDDAMVRVSYMQMEGINMVEPRNDGTDSPFYQGLIFDSKKELVHAVSKLAIKRGFPYKAVKNTSKYYNVVCSLNERVCKEKTNDANNKCPWRLFAHAGSRIGGKFKITSYVGEHTCNNSIV